MSQQVSTESGAAEDGARPVSRTPAEIEAEIERTRDSLAGSIDELQDKLSPASLAAAVRARALKVFQRPDGSLDPVRVSAVVGVALLLVTYAIRKRRI